MARTRKIVEVAIAAALFVGCAGSVLAQDAATAIAARKAAMKANGAAPAALGSVTAVPEPAACAIVFLGATFAMRRRRRRA